MGQRLSVSLFNQFDIKEVELDQLQIAACEYLRTNAMFFPDGWIQLFGP
jgi:hypothetical protein